MNREDMTPQEELYLRKCQAGYLVHELAALDFMYLPVRTAGPFYDELTGRYALPIIGAMADTLSEAADEWADAYRHLISNNPIIEDIPNVTMVVAPIGRDYYGVVMETGQPFMAIDDVNHIVRDSDSLMLGILAAVRKLNDGGIL